MEWRCDKIHVLIPSHMLKWSEVFMSYLLTAQSYVHYEGESLFTDVFHPSIQYLNEDYTDEITRLRATAFR